jgi:Protein of unknown function (DUF3105)
VSRRTNPPRRLERRNEREARQRASTAPRPERVRPTRTTPTRVRSGFLSSIPLVGIAIAVGALVIVGILVYAITQANNKDTGPLSWQKAELDSSTNLPGQYIPPHPGADNQLCTNQSCVQGMDDRQHVGNGVKIPICTADQIAENKLSDPSYGPAGVCYNSNPPTSGPHAANPMPFKVLDNPAPKENLVHDMEHGGVVVWYNTDDQNVIKQLSDIVNDNLDRRRLVVMSQYTEMEPNTIALTAWTRLDKFSAGDFSKKRVQDFISEHNKRFNPEGF